MCAKQIRFIENRPVLYESVSKTCFEGTQFNTNIIHFKDSVKDPKTGTNVTVPQWGEFNNALSSYIFERLNLLGHQTHFLARQNAREQLVHNVDMIPVEWHCHNMMPEAFSKHCGLETGAHLSAPLIEPYVLLEGMQEQRIATANQLDVLGLLSEEEFKVIEKNAKKINQFLCGFFVALGYSLRTTRLRYGRYYNELIEEPEILLADEISLETCELESIETGEKIGLEQVFKPDAEPLNIYDTFESKNSLMQRLKLKQPSNAELEQVVSIHKNKKKSDDV